MKMPNQVPRLTASDICRGIDRNTRNQCCLQGWAVTVFTKGQCFYSEVPEIVRDALKKSTLKLGELSNWDICAFTDNHSNSKALIARVFNHAMNSLGYTDEFWLQEPAWNKKFLTHA